MTSLQVLVLKNSLKIIGYSFIVFTSIEKFAEQLLITPEAI